MTMNTTTPRTEAAIEYNWEIDEGAVDSKVCRELETELNDALAKLREAQVEIGNLQRQIDQDQELIALYSERPSMEMLNDLHDKLTAIAALPEKWKRESINQGPIPLTIWGTATQLEAALASPPAVEPVPAIPAQTYYTPGVVQQRREEAAAINEVMNPPADKWAAEKAAHARGEKIQRQDRIIGGKWHDDPDPNWHNGCRPCCRHG